MKKANAVTIMADDELVSKMVRFYAEQSKKPTSEFVYFFASNADFAVTIYKKKHSDGHAVIFQGEQAEHEALIWGSIASSKKEKAIKKPTFPQIGSDEVGTGDFFGPICVCAAYVTKKDLSLLNKLGVADSKTLSDEKILAIGPTLIKTFEYSQISLDNAKYNEVFSKNMNMNKIKALLHNQCLLNLQKKFPSARLCQDQFAEEELYYKYLEGEKEVARGIEFSIKGEDAFPSVALASVLARYSFLKKMEKLSKDYRMNFPFGAGEKVDVFAKKFVKKYGIEELNKVAKINFTNYKKLLSEPLF